MLFHILQNILLPNFNIFQKSITIHTLKVLYLFTLQKLCGCHEGISDGRKL